MGGGVDTMRLEGHVHLVGDGLLGSGGKPALYIEQTCLSECKNNALLTARLERRESDNFTPHVNPRSSRGNTKPVSEHVRDLGVGAHVRNE